MDFNGQYLKYTEYDKLGGTLKEMPFNLIEYECRRIIDERTLNRLRECEDIPEEVKMCIFQMINKVDNYQKSLQKNEQGISSENIDGYSVSYSSNITEIIKSKSEEFNDMVTTYLFGVVVNNEHIIYIGV